MLQRGVLNDDMKDFMELVDDECVRETMATGEVFTGAAEVRKWRNGPW